jgi:hypothetical protein
MTVRYDDVPIDTQVLGDLLVSGRMDLSISSRADEELVISKEDAQVDGILLDLMLPPRVASAMAGVALGDLQSAMRVPPQTHTPLSLSPPPLPTQTKDSPGDMVADGATKRFWRADPAQWLLIIVLVLLYLASRVDWPLGIFLREFSAYLFP